jgi:hypothetical protein
MSMSIELRALECKTLGNRPVDFVANIHNRQRQFKFRASGMRTNYWVSYHFPINPNTFSNYAGLKYAAILKQPINLLFRLLHSFMSLLPSHTDPTYHCTVHTRITLLYI